MAFDQSHIYWTFHWSVTGVPEEFGQIGIRSGSPGTPPTLTTVDAVGDAFQSFWIAANSHVSTLYRFFRVKAALIRPDGSYDPDFDPVIDDRSSVGGSVTTPTGVFPLQVAHSLQLTTDRSSGLAHAGRVYLPPVAATLDASLSAPSASVSQRVTTFAAFLTAMNAALGTENVLVMSSKGTGASRTVTGVRADSRLDVQRRRARQQPTTWSPEVAVS